MIRCTGANNVGAPPAYAAGPSAAGYYSVGTPGVVDPTTLQAADMNQIQEELVALATAKGAALSSASTSQCITAVSGALALDAAVADTGAVSSYWSRLVAASTASQSSGAHTAVIASDTCTATTGAFSAVLASDTCDVTGDDCIIAASNGTVMGGTLTAAIAADGCTGDSNGVNVAFLATENCEDDTVAATTFCAAIASRDCTLKGDRNAVIAGAGAAVVDGQLCSMISFDSCSIAATAVGCGIMCCSSSQVDGAYNFAAAGDAVAIDGARNVSLASDGTSLDGAKNAALASENGVTDANVLRSAIIAANTCTIKTANSYDSAVIACADTDIIAHRSVAIGCWGSAGSKCGVGAAVSGQSVLVASSNAELVTAYAIGGGSTGGACTPDGLSDKQLTWRVNLTAGDGYWDGNHNAGPADYAELYENLTPGVLPVGSLVTLRGKKVRLAQPGDRVLGVVSANPAIIGNASSLGWAGRFEVDEWGRKVMVDVEHVRWGKSADRAGYDGFLRNAPTPIPEDAVRWSVAMPKPAAGYDPSRPYVERKQRPEEWTVVGLLGQIRTRVDATVAVDDDVMPGEGGVGTLGEGRGKAIVCMDIEVPFDAERGYAIALCQVG